MSFPYLLIGAILLYILAGGLVWNSLSSSRGSAKTALITAACALILQIAYLASIRFSGAPIDFSASSMALVICTVVVSIYLLGCLGMEIQKLGVLVFPLAALSVVFSLLWGGSSAASSYHLLPISAFSAHVLISVLAYSLLSIAVVQSVLYLYQEKQFQKRTTPGMLSSLPPLQTMETLLFRLVWMGFILLSATLLSGAIFSKAIFDQAFEFNHHTVLATLGWLAFGNLLFQRWRNGIRGLPATIWTLLGFALIQLGYFGTKIISEALSL